MYAGVINTARVCVCVRARTVKAQLLEQEEKEREARRRMTQKGGSRFGGQISTFSLGSGLAAPRMSTTSDSVSSTRCRMAFG